MTLYLAIKRRHSMMEKKRIYTYKCIMRGARERTQSILYLDVYKYFLHVKKPKGRLRNRRKKMKEESDIRMK